MEKLEVKTLIKRNHKFGENEFILGRISGIGYIVANKKGFALMEICEGNVYRNEFTPDEYDKFMNIIEDLYPGLCEFNYQIKRESY